MLDSHSERRSLLRSVLSRTRCSPSIIGADLRVVGDVESAGDVLVDGTVEGNINTQNVVINEGAHIVGSIVAETAQISGSVTGRVVAVSVNLARTAKVVGSIFHNDLSIEDGAVLDGLKPWRPVQHFSSRQTVR